MAMAFWQTFLAILLWPGQQVMRLFPDLGTAEARLLHNMVNYIVWLSLFCGLLIWAVIALTPAPA